MKIRFHTVTCSRCGGSGRFGPTSVYAGNCFKCAGRGKVLSPAGAKASAALRSFYTADPRFSKPVTEVVVGDVIMSGDTVVTATGVAPKRSRKVSVTQAEYSTYSDGAWATMHLEYTGDPLEPQGGTSWKLGGPVPRVFLPLIGERWAAYLAFAQALTKGVYITDDAGAFVSGDNPEAAAAKRVVASEKRRVSRTARKARNAEALAASIESDRAKLTTLLTNPGVREALAAQPHPKMTGKTLLDYAEWLFANTTSGYWPRILQLIDGAASVSRETP